MTVEDVALVENAEKIITRKEEKGLKDNKINLAIKTLDNRSYQRLMSPQVKEKFSSPINSQEIFINTQVDVS